MGKSMSGNNSAQMNASLDLYHVTLAFLVSFLAWPLTYVLNNGFTSIDQAVRPFWMLTFGGALLVLIVFLVGKLSAVTDWLYFGVTLFAFTCMIDIIMVLEYNGVISGFMTEYLKFGEPYLHSPWGNALALFDGTGFYTMYLLMAFFISNGISWRSTGIYWAAAILNSMIVLLLGVLVGKHGVTSCAVFEIPYVLLPVATLFRAFGRESRGGWSNTIKTGIVEKALDLVLALSLISTMWVCTAKGLGAIGTMSNVTLIGLIKHEPLLNSADPAPFPAIQMFLYLFYLVPIQGISLWYTFKSVKPQFLWDLTLVHAAVMLQSQFSFICTALDPQTPQDFRSDWSDSTFWLVNLWILVVPHLFLFRLSLHKRSSTHLKQR